MFIQPLFTQHVKPVIKVLNQLSVWCLNLNADASGTGDPVWNLCKINVCGETPHVWDEQKEEEKDVVDVYLLETAPKT